MKLAIAAPILGLLIVGACSTSARSVRASAYDQTCAASADCVAVAELEANARACSEGCPTEAINRKELDRFRSDLRASQEECSSQGRDYAAPICMAVDPPMCEGGRCVITAGPRDAGAD